MDGESASLPRGWPRRAALVLLTLCVLIFSVGCAPYRMQGKVVEGTTPGVFIVDKSDERLEQSGLPGAVVALTLEPGRLSSERLGNDISDMDGAFAVPVDKVGAGVLEYNVGVRVRLEDHATVRDRFILPGTDDRVLVVMTRGESHGDAEDESFLDETMRMGEPYMK